MKTLYKLILDLISVNEQIDQLYKHKKDIEKSIKDEHNRLREECGRTGKTVEELEETEDKK